MGYSKSKMLARGAAVLMIAATLPGCLPLTTPTLISLAVDGISFMATGTVMGKPGFVFENGP